MNSIHHEKHEDFVKQAHIKTAAAPNISEIFSWNPTTQLAGDPMLVDVSFRQAERETESVESLISVLSHQLLNHIAQLR